VVFWVVTLCGLVGKYRHFFGPEGKYRHFFGPENEDSFLESVLSTYQNPGSKLKFGGKSSGA
jgi:hypothetical protein